MNWLVKKYVSHDEALNSMQF